MANMVLNRSTPEIPHQQTVLHTHRPVCSIPNWGSVSDLPQCSAILHHYILESLGFYPLKNVYCNKFIVIKSKMFLPHFAESWLHGWSDGVPTWLMFRREEPEQNLSWRKEINRVALLSLTYVTPVCCHTPGLGDALGLKCIVCAAVVQVVTETADHQSQ